MSFSAWDEHAMRLALAQARQAADKQEVPVGAVLTLGEQVLAEAHNAPIGLHDPSAHAEILALRAASLRLQNYRLPGATLYVTLEPCTMCVGALLHSRVARVVFAAPEPRAGALGSVLALHQCEHYNHRLQVDSGLLAEDSAELLRQFFRARRQK